MWSQGKDNSTGTSAQNTSNSKPNLSPNPSPKEKPQNPRSSILPSPKELPSPKQSPKEKFLQLKQKFIPQKTSPLAKFSNLKENILPTLIKESEELSTESTRNQDELGKNNFLSKDSYESIYNQKFYTQKKILLNHLLTIVTKINGEYLEFSDVLESYGYGKFLDELDTLIKEIITDAEQYKITLGKIYNLSEMQKNTNLKRATLLSKIEELQKMELTYYTLTWSTLINDIPALTDNLRINLKEYQERPTRIAVNIDTLIAHFVKLNSDITTSLIALKLIIAKFTGFSNESIFIETAIMAEVLPKINLFEINLVDSPPSIPMNLEMCNRINVILFNLICEKTNNKNLGKTMNSSVSINDDIIPLAKATDCTTIVMDQLFRQKFFQTKEQAQLLDLTAKIIEIIDTSKPKIDNIEKPTIGFGSLRTELIAIIKRIANTDAAEEKHDYHRMYLEDDPNFYLNTLQPLVDNCIQDLQTVIRKIYSPKTIPDGLNEIIQSLSKLLHARHKNHRESVDLNKLVNYFSPIPSCKNEVAILMRLKESIYTVLGITVENTAVFIKKSDINDMLCEGILIDDILSRKEVSDCNKINIIIYNLMCTEFLRTGFNCSKLSPMLVHHDKITDTEVSDLDSVCNAFTTAKRLNEKERKAVESYPLPQRGQSPRDPQPTKKEKIALKVSSFPQQSFTEEEQKAVQAFSSPSSPRAYSPRLFHSSPASPTETQKIPRSPVGILQRARRGSGNSESTPITPQEGPSSEKSFFQPASSLTIKLTETPNIPGSPVGVLQRARPHGPGSPESTPTQENNNPLVESPNDEKQPQNHPRGSRG